MVVDVEEEPMEQEQDAEPYADMTAEEADQMSDEDVPAEVDFPSEPAEVSEEERPFFDPSSPAAFIDVEGTDPEQDEEPDAELTVEETAQPSAEEDVPIEVDMQEEPAEQE